ncbi:hypothetical protein M0765_001605 [Variovorax sp. S2]|uniref:hypothetical protein n=1 Tax=Variovorax sp. S12S4 TaxID=3029170 RepID=UPI00215D24A0|nr:hypothetical protein [Variovorax sp. S12S4]MCR8956472.1 hypothetical protein [Variovorax sp. S12S4]
MDDRAAVDISAPCQVGRELEAAIAVQQRGNAVPHGAGLVGFGKHLRLEGLQGAGQRPLGPHTRAQGVLGPARGALQEPARLEHRVAVLVLVEELVHRRHVLVRMAVQQVDAQCAVPFGAVGSQAVVRRFVVGAAVAFFHLEQEDVDRRGVRIARLPHRMREPHHLGKDAPPRHELRGHVVDLVGHAVAVGVAGVGQRMLAVQCVEDAELVAHMAAIQARKICLARRSAFLRRRRKSGGDHAADEEKSRFP